MITKKELLYKIEILEAKVELLQEESKYTLQSLKGILDVLNKYFCVEENENS